MPSWRKARKRSVHRTLKVIRREAPRQERDSPALTPLPDVASQSGKVSRYIKADFIARTLDELEARCGEYGAMACIKAQWSAMERWMMWRDDLVHGEARAVALYSQHVMATIRYPSLIGKPVISPLPDLEPADRAEVIRMALSAFEAWQAAGSPKLAITIPDEQRHIHSHAVQLYEQSERTAA